MTGLDTEGLIWDDRVARGGMDGWREPKSAWERRHARFHDRWRGCIHVVLNMEGRFTTLDDPEIPIDVREAVEAGEFVGWIDPCILAPHKGPHHSSTCGEWSAKDEDFADLTQKMTHVYAWKNNPRRAELQGKECRILVDEDSFRDFGKRTVLVRFADGTKVVTDKYALRRIGKTSYFYQETLV